MIVVDVVIHAVNMSFLLLIFRIHLKELSKDLEDDLVQFVNNMLHLEKMRSFIVRLSSIQYKLSFV